MHSNKFFLSQFFQFVGLKNLGNTCFMNSVLQSLNNIDEFSQRITSLPSQDTNKQRPAYCSRSTVVDRDFNLSEELRKVYMDLNQGGDGSKAIWPEYLFMVIWKVVPQFRGHRQHDAHEFLRYMLDRLHTELQDSSSATNSTSTAPLKAITNGANGVPGSAKDSIVTNIFGGTLQSEVFSMTD